MFVVWKDKLIQQAFIVFRQFKIYRRILKLTLKWPFIQFKVQVLNLATNVSFSNSADEIFQHLRVKQSFLQNHLQTHLMTSTTKDTVTNRLTSLILRSSFTTSVGFMSFCWKALLTLCQSFPSLQGNSSDSERIQEKKDRKKKSSSRTRLRLQPNQQWLLFHEREKNRLTEWGARTPRLSCLCKRSRVWSPVSGGNSPPFCTVTPASKVRQCAPIQKSRASDGKSCQISCDNQPRMDLETQQSAAENR